MKRDVSVGTAALAHTFAPTPASAAAQAADAWRHSAAFYGCFPDISGKTRFPTTNSGSDLSLDTGTILDALKLAFMDAAEAHNDRPGVFADVIYMDVGGSKAASSDLVIGDVIRGGTTSNSTTT